LFPLDGILAPPGTRLRQKLTLELTARFVAAHQESRERSETRKLSLVRGADVQPILPAIELIAAC